ncbi:hypothetical protein Dimus_011967 [Dionaea muscipula]
MALSQPPPFLIKIAILLVFFFIVPAALSAARRVDHIPVGFKVELKRVDSESNLTKLERVQRALVHGRNRLQRLNAMVLSKSTISSSSYVTAPVHVGDGEFLMTLAIGTPPKSYSAIVDTGSDLIWTQCEPCTRCYRQPTPVFEPRASSSFSNLSCSSELCQQLMIMSSTTTSSYCYSDQRQPCQYTYGYADQSFTDGTLASETFTFGSVSVPNIVFGCGSDNEGVGFVQGAGLVGLGRGPLSLVSQLDEPKFSYCLVSFNDMSKSSTLLMGSTADLSLPSENYVIANSTADEICVALGSSVGISVFGNIQQQNFLVLHDLENQVVSFIPTTCG